MGDYFIFSVCSTVSQISHPRTHIAQRRGQFLETVTSVHIPTGPLTTCSSVLWEKKKKKRELISCPRLCEGTLLLHMSRVTGVNSATRGRFTGTESNHRSTVLCLSRPVQTETFRTVVAMKIELKIMDRKGHVLGHSLPPVLSIPL